MRKKYGPKGGKTYRIYIYIYIISITGLISVLCFVFGLVGHAGGGGGKEGRKEELEGVLRITSRV